MTMFRVDSSLRGGILYIYVYIEKKRIDALDMKGEKGIEGRRGSAAGLRVARGMVEFRRSAVTVYDARNRPGTRRPLDQS